MTYPIFELRQYQLNPEMREVLIELFDRELLETQERCGIEVVGQFRDQDRPDCFVWLRAFDSIESRVPALAAFYDGPVWRRHRDAANATMKSSDDVLMLRQAWQGAADGLRGLPRPAVEGALATHVAVAVHALDGARSTMFVEWFRHHYQPRLAARGVQFLGALVSEHRENAFPRLPVREGESVFVWFGRLASDDVGISCPIECGGEVQRMRLVPTSRSRMR